jgi:hypothetical protein
MLGAPINVDTSSGLATSIGNAGLAGMQGQAAAGIGAMQGQAQAGLGALQGGINQGLGRMSDQVAGGLQAVTPHDTVGSWDDIASNYDFSPRGNNFANGLDGEPEDPRTKPTAPTPIRRTGP